MSPQQPPYTEDAGGGLARRGTLGVTLKRTADDSGVRVSALTAEGSAARAGVRVDDVLLALDGAAVGRPRDAAAVLGRLRTGQTVKLEVRRGEDVLRLAAVLAPLPVEPLKHGDIRLLEVTAGEARLRGIWCVPRERPPWAMVYYLQTSDWGPCEHPLRPQHPETQWIDGLAHAGVSSFRLERSDTGDSQGPPLSQVDWHTELSGYRAGLKYLQQHSPLPLFLMGNSLGGMVAPLLASDVNVAGVPAALAGVAVIGASAASWHDCLLGARQRAAERDGRFGAAFDAETERLRWLQQRVLCEGLMPRQVYAEHPDLTGQFPWFEGEMAYGRGATFFQQLQACDLRQAWSQVEVPVLVMHGADDDICTWEDARDIVAATRTAAALQLADVDHGWRQPGAVAQVVRSLVGWMRPLALHARAG